MSGARCRRVGIGDRILAGGVPNVVVSVSGTRVRLADDEGMVRTVTTAELADRTRFEIPAYSTCDASAGVSKDAWTFTIYGENLANSNASTFSSTDQFILAQTPLRPRVIGGSFSYSF